MNFYISIQQATWKLRELNQICSKISRNPIKKIQNFLTHNSEAKKKNFISLLITLASSSRIRKKMCMFSIRGFELADCFDIAWTKIKAFDSPL